MRALLEILGIKQSREEGLFDLVLLNRKRNMAVCVCVGRQEAGYIALALEKKRTPCPCVFDVFVSSLYHFDVGVEFVEIHSFEDGVYAARLFLSSRKEGKMFPIRLSDAVNLALRARVPIYIKEEVLEQVGFDADVLTARRSNAAIEEDETFEESLLGIIADLDLETLEELMNDALKRDDYKMALLLRNQIDERRKGNR